MNYFEKRESMLNREKPSWRDRDNKNKESRHLGKDKPNPLQNREDGLAKKALENLFVKKKSKAQIKDYKELCAAKGKDFAEKAIAYVEKHKMPTDWEELIRLLDHPDPSFVANIVAALDASADEQKTSKIDLCVGKLRIVKMTMEDPRALDPVTQLLNKLSAKL